MDCYQIKAWTHNEFLTQIRDLPDHVNPQSVMIDFEKSMMGALHQVYPAVPQKGCLFHLFKNVYKRVQDEGMSQLYMSDEDFRTNIRMISELRILLMFIANLNAKVDFSH